MLHSPSNSLMRNSAAMKQECDEHFAVRPTAMPRGRQTWGRSVPSSPKLLHDGYAKRSTSRTQYIALQIARILLSRLLFMQFTGLYLYSPQDVRHAGVKRTVCLSI